MIIDPNNSYIKRYLSTDEKNDSAESGGFMSSCFKVASEFFCCLPLADCLGEEEKKSLSPAVKGLFSPKPSPKGAKSEESIASIGMKGRLDALLKELDFYANEINTFSTTPTIDGIIAALMAIYYVGMIAITPLLFLMSFITNKRYMNEDVIWGRPKSLICGNFVGAGPEQQPNLYPDMYSTYFVGNIRLPEGASLTLKGRYPHARYLSFTIANQLGAGQLGDGYFLRGDMINPDEGSSNPFDSKNSRDVKERDFTLKVVQGNPPENPPPNTLYTGTNSPDEHFHLSMRTYLVDDGYDGTGNELLFGGRNGLPEVVLNLADGTSVKGPELVKLLDAKKTGDPSGYDQETWVKEVNSSKYPTPSNAPCLPLPASQRFWNTNYTVSGAFILDPKARVETYPATDSGGFANNPDTCYMVMPYSLNYGDVLVVRGKMPTHPSTKRGEKRLPEVQPEVQYFSVSTAAAPSDGEGWYTLCDEEIEVDDEGYYTIAVSTPWKRPADATIKNKVSWITNGHGEGYFDGARPLCGVVYFRFQNPNESWDKSPAKIPEPTPDNAVPQDPEVMQEYYPRGVYMSKAEFEQHSTDSLKKLFIKQPFNPLNPSNNL